jgi:hypothetical protein
VHLAILGADRMQPYVYALAAEVRAQLAELDIHSRRTLGHAVDTTTLSAQDSEHIGKVCKEIERSISDHKTIQIGSCDMNDYYTDRCFRPFTYENVVKLWAVRHGITKRRQC